MRWKERRRRHDDVHFPLQGKGKRATRSRQDVRPAELCPHCRLYPKGRAHACTMKFAGDTGLGEMRDPETGKPWRETV